LRKFRFSISRFKSRLVALMTRTVLPATLCTAAARQARRSGGRTPRSAVACRPFQERLNELEFALDKTDYDKARDALARIACINGHDFNE